MTKTKPKRTQKTNPVPPASRPEPTHEEVASLAYATWEHDGRIPGRDLKHWLLAENQLRAHFPIHAIPA